MAAGARADLGPCAVRPARRRRTCLARAATILAGDVFPAELIAAEQRPAARLALLRRAPPCSLSDLHLLQPAQRPQAHVQDRLRLGIRSDRMRPSARAWRRSSSRMMRITSVQVQVDDRGGRRRMSSRFGRSWPGGGALRRPSTTWRWSSHACSTSRRPMTIGVRVGGPARSCSAGSVSRTAVARNSVSISIAGSTVRLFGSSTTRTSSLLSSRMSASSGSFLASSNSATCSIRRDLLHLIGDLGHHDLPGAVLQFLAFPSAPAAESRRGPIS